MGRVPACGAIAQLGERNNGIVEVVGSIPTGSTKYLFHKAVYASTVYGYVNYDDRPSDRTAMTGLGWQVYGALGVPFSRQPFGYLGGALLKIWQIADAHATSRSRSSGPTRTGMPVHISRTGN